MATTMAFAGNTVQQRNSSVLQDQLYGSIILLFEWLEHNDYKGYDTFDGLSAIVRPLTFETKLLRIALQQSVRRFVLNTRPLLGIKKSRSSKAMGFLARGFLRLHKYTREELWREKAEFALQWLMDNQSKGYSGSCWGNHFDYQSRTFYFPKDVPSLVWTSLIGHAFLDAYSGIGKEEYLTVANSACEHILRDLKAFPHGDTVCITYVPGLDGQVHNANVLGASLLSRAYSYVGDRRYLELANKAFRYTAQHQRADGSWYYAERADCHWIDNFHTGYVLDAFKHYLDSTGDDRFLSTMNRGYDHWKRHFFLPDGTPRYYDQKTLPIDIQCCSQAIDTCVLFKDLDRESLELASKVAQWTMTNMQDKTGYFYYRRFSPWLVNKTPTLHWGQATMLCALAGLYSAL